MNTTCASALILLAACVSVAAAADAPNLALGRPYTMSPAPNYALCTDPGDAVQLTDGKRVGADMFWGQAGTVGWAATNAVQIIVDLGAVKPIGSVAFSTASRLNAGVGWPTIIIGVSDDGAAYHMAGQIPAFVVPGQDPTQEYRHDLSLTGLRTRGRFVMFFALPGGSYMFSDEIEVYGGSHDPSQVQFTGRTLTPEGFHDYLALARTQAWLTRQCLRLADEAQAAGRDSRSAPALSGAAKELRALAQRLPSFPYESLPDARRQMAAMCARANSALHGGKPYLVWERNAFAPLAALEIPRGPSVSRLEIHAASNEYSSAAVAITNATPQALTMTARIEDLRGPNATIAAKDIALRCVQFVEARNGEFYADALPLLDEHGLRIPAGETSQIWLTFPKRRLPPGDYRGRLVLQPARNGQAEGRPADRGLNAPTAVDVLLRVYPVELPDDMTLQTYNWAYVTTFGLVRGLEREAVADLFAHYTNTFVFSGGDVPWPVFDKDGKGTIDFTAHDRNLALHRGAREISWFWSFTDAEQADGGRFGADYLSPQWKERCAWWLRAWVAHLKELGYGYDDFFMYPFDETLCDRFRNVAAFIKEVDPKVRVFADPVSSDTRARIEAIAPSIDVWCPHLFTYEERLNDVEFMRAHGQKLWTYVCSGPAKALSPNSYYRLMMWKAWQRGYTGCGFWAYADAGWSGTDAWNDFDGANCDFAVIYTARNAPPGVPRNEAIITSKRWEAWREGIEDYELMRLVADAAKRAEAAGDTAKAQALRTALSKAVEEALALPDEPAAIESARRRLLAAFR